MKALLILFLLPCALLRAQGKSIDAQAFEQAFNAVKKNYQKESYKLGYQHYLFLHPADPKPYFTSKGMFIRGKGKEYRTMSAGQLTVQTNAVKMVIDSTNKLVLLLKPDTLYNPLNLDLSEAFWKDAIFHVSTAGNLKKYHVDFNLNDYEYSFIEYWIDAKTHHLQKVIMQMREGNYYNVEDESTESPRLVVDYDAPSAKLTGKEFELQEFLSEQGGIYTLTPALKGFELDDLRVKDGQ